jgi:hypothetical protein
MTGLRRFGRIVLAVLRELSDQSAYQRHLAAHGRQHSKQEWRNFCDVRHKAKYQQPKCC